METYWTFGNIVNGIVCAGIGYFGYIYTISRVNEVKKIKSDLDDLTLHLAALKQEVEDSKNCDDSVV